MFPHPNISECSLCQNYGWKGWTSFLIIVCKVLPDVIIIRNHLGAVWIPSQEESHRKVIWFAERSYILLFIISLRCIKYVFNPHPCLQNGNDFFVGIIAHSKCFGTHTTVPKVSIKVLFTVPPNRARGYVSKFSFCLSQVALFIWWSKCRHAVKTNVSQISIFVLLGVDCLWTIPSLISRSRRFVHFPDLSLKDG